MRKVIAFILAAVTLLSLLSLAGCGAPEEQPETTHKPKPPVTVATEATEEATSVEQKNEFEIRSGFGRGVKPLYINYREGRREESGRVSTMFRNLRTHNDIIAAGYVEYTDTETDTIKLINERIRQDGGVLWDISEYSIPEAYFRDTDKSYEITVTERSPATIGELDATRVIGYTIDARGRKCFVYGYTFEMKETPCFLLGFVFTEAQEQELKDTIAKEVEGMMRTVRPEF